MSSFPTGFPMGPGTATSDDGARSPSPRSAPTWPSLRWLYLFCLSWLTAVGGGLLIAARTIQQWLWPRAVAADSATPSWRRGFETMDTTGTRHLTRVDGEVPKALCGALFRNGPAGDVAHGHALAHWFDGDGMVCAFRFHDGKVTFTNRHVRTPEFEAEQDAARRLYPRNGTFRPGGPLLNMPIALYNAANVNVVPYEDRLLALSDMGMAMALDRTTLQTLGVEDFGGGLPARQNGHLSAHPHRDPRSGALVAIRPVFGPGMFVRARWEIVEARPGEPGCVTGRFRTRYPIMAHDFGLTENKVIVLGSTQSLSLARTMLAGLGLVPAMQCLSWYGHRPLLAHVADRRGAQPSRTYEFAPGSAMHVVNAYEQDGCVIVDAVRYKDDRAMRAVGSLLRGKAMAAEGSLVRFTMYPDGRSEERLLRDAPLEMATVHPDRQSRPYRYCYALETDGRSPLTGRLVKMDVESGRPEHYDFGPNCYASEPVFAADGDKAEDDGWVLSLVYDGETHRSFLAVLDARRFAAGPVARVHLPFHVPHGFHGCFETGATWARADVAGEA